MRSLVATALGTTATSVGVARGSPHGHGRESGLLRISIVRNVLHSICLLGVSDVLSPDLGSGDGFENRHAQQPIEGDEAVDVGHDPPDYLP